MPLQEEVAAGARAAEGEDPGSSTTDGESDTCVDEEVLCPSASR
jgi:hypothetical protein